MLFCNGEKTTLKVGDNIVLRQDEDGSPWVSLSRNGEPIAVKVGAELVQEFRAPRKKPWHFIAVIVSVSGLAVRPVIVHLAQINDKQMWAFVEPSEESKE